ncbi:MAG TPA: response regulator, partial [Steroidobacteraceae bacterium]|nr:response regulator [Steroidobacteraceae bacterium]
FSEGKDRGSEFVITLPLMPRELARVRAASGDTGSCECGDSGDTGDPRNMTSPGQDQTRRRILVADDNSDALESLAMLLELGGHEVYTASNGVLALESAERHQPDVALLDIGMPELDGYEVARRIRSQPWGRSITLVALTGWGQESDRRRSGEAGFDSHLVKPLDLEQLSRLLAELPDRLEAAPAPL